MKSLNRFSSCLLCWYNKNKRDLPWRHTNDPYKIWISEIMLQQTTVNAVIPYFDRWVKLFPNMQDVADAPLQKILKAWQGLGYYQRAKNIHHCAQIIRRDHQEKIPSQKEALRKLPGFGPYTTGAVLSIAFDKREPIIDANVRRVVMRQLARQGKAESKHDDHILKFLDHVMPLRGNNIFNQALMELGALVCRNHQPLCIKCPVKSSCRAYEKGIQEIIPAPQKIVIKILPAVIAVIEKKGKYFIQKRSSKGLLADLWEFPGGKIKAGERPEQALRRELREEIGAEIETCKHLMNARHFYTHFRVNLSVWLCTPKNEPKIDSSHKWVTPKQLLNYPLPSGSAKIVDHILS